MIRDRLPSVPVKWRFYIAHGFLFVCAVALVAIAAYEVATPDNAGSSNGRTVGSDPASGGSTPSPAASKLEGFAASFQDYVQQAQASFGGPVPRVVDCVQGNGTHFCAFIIEGVCHGAILDDDTMEVVNQQAGIIGIPAASCNARNALKWIGSQG